MGKTYLLLTKLATIFHAFSICLFHNNVAKYGSCRKSTKSKYQYGSGGYWRRYSWVSYFSSFSLCLLNILVVHIIILKLKQICF